MPRLNLFDYFKIGDNIRMVREKSGKTQREMAMLLDIPVSTYSNYENGNRTPNMDVLNKLAKLLNVPLAVLLGIKPTDISYPEATTTAQTHVTINIDSTSLDEVLEKATRLAELLQKIQQTINSFTEKT